MNKYMLQRILAVKVMSMTIVTHATGSVTFVQESSFVQSASRTPP